LLELSSRRSVISPAPNSARLNWAQA